jgi:hypothetical protein
MNQCTWDEAREQLHPAVADYFNDAEAEVSAGREVVFRVCGDSFALLRVEKYEETGETELVIVGFSGDLATSAIALFEYGRALGCLRCHTPRKGEAKFLNSVGIPMECVGLDDDGHFILKVQYGR